MTKASDIDTGDEMGDVPSRRRWNRGRVMMAGMLGGLLLVILLGFLACQPQQGTIYYGICSALLNQNIVYPETIHHTGIEQYPNSVRIYFTSTDAFGQFKLEMMECAFKNDAQKGLVIDRALFNRTDMDPKIIEKFNPSIPAVLAANPDLTLPPDVPFDVESLKQDD